MYKQTSITIQSSKLTTVNERLVKQLNNHLSSVLSTGMFDNVVCGGLLTTVMLNVAFKSGSSKFGKAVRASIASICVATKYLRLQRA